MTFSSSTIETKVERCTELFEDFDYKLYGPTLGRDKKLQQRIRKEEDRFATAKGIFPRGPCAQYEPPLWAHLIDEIWKDEPYIGERASEELDIVIAKLLGLIDIASGKTTLEAAGQRYKEQIAEMRAGAAEDDKQYSDAKKGGKLRRFLGHFHGKHDDDTEKKEETPTMTAITEETIKYWDDAVPGKEDEVRRLYSINLDMADINRSITMFFLLWPSDPKVYAAKERESDCEDEGSQC